MKEYREESLESQITSMLKQVMDEDRNEKEEKLFSSDNEEEEIEDNTLNTKIQKNYNKRIQFKDDVDINNHNHNTLMNNFIRKNQRFDKKFQTVNSHNSLNLQNPYFFTNRNYFQTQIIQNPFNFNINSLNSLPNHNFLRPNYMINNLNNNIFNNINNFQRSSNRKKTYDAKFEKKDIKRTEIRNNDKKFGSVIFPKETNLKLELLIYELKNILYRSDKIGYFIYNKIQGNIVDIIKTHKGSRIFQNYLKNTHCDILHQIFTEINPHLNELLIDPYANYFCKKFFTFINTKDRIDFLNSIKDSLIKLSSNNIGTFPIQGIIEHIGSKLEKEIIVDTIKNNIPELSTNPYSCHVIEKILSCFEEKYITFIYDYISENFLFLSYNSSGICLVKKIVSFTHKIKFHEQIKQIVEENSMELIIHPYGNYVIQELIESWNLNEVKQSLLLYKNKFTTLSMEKYSSNVMEKYIEKSDDILNEYIDEIIFNGKIFEIMKNNYGNFVIQKALKLSSGEKKKKLVIEVSKNIYMLNDNKLIMKWKDLILNELKNLQKEEIQIV